MTPSNPPIPPSPDGGGDFPVLFVVLPAYNEAPRIATLLQRVHDTLQDREYSVVLVDDGSADGTGDVVRGLMDRIPIDLVVHEVNQGLGATIRDGLVRAAERAAPSDIIITLDADDTHRPETIPSMLQRIDEGCDVVIASRYRRGSRVQGVPPHRQALSGGAALLMRATFPIRGVRDYTCGYRAYRAAAIQGALDRYGDGFLDQDGFQCMVDILLKLRSLDLTFGEVPFVLRYDAKEGASKMNVGRTVRSTLQLLVRTRLRG